MNSKLGFAVLIVGLLAVPACDTEVVIPAATEFSRPPLLAPDSMDIDAEGNRTLDFSLTMQRGKTEFIPGRPASTMGINGDFLGPVVRVSRGDTVNFHVQNKLGELTTLHWHGLHIPPDVDGGPHQQIAADTTWSPSFTIDNRAGLYWFHPHLEGLTGRHVYNGLAGLMIIDDEEEGALDLPRSYGVDDIPIIVQDRRIDEDGNLLYMNEFTDHTGMRGRSVLVNGKHTPPLGVPAQRIRLRILNASNARFYNLGFSDSRNFQVIASDGGLLAQPVTQTRLRIGSGERYEIVVDLTDMRGKTIEMQSFSSELGFSGAGFDELDGTTFPIMTLEVGTPTATVAGPVPQTLSVIPELKTSIQNTRSFVVRMGVGGVMTINNKTMKMSRIDETVFLGDTEEWVLRNASGVPHPIHIHDVQFRVLSRRQGAPLPYETGWKDTVVLGPRETVRVQMTFEDFANPDVPYMYHCHILEHEDRGMMGQFLVVNRN